MAHCYFLLAPQIKVKLRLHNGLKFSDRRICEKCGYCPASCDNSPIKANLIYPKV